MIKLTKPQEELVLICKGHLSDKYPRTGQWHNTLKPWWHNHLGWNPDDDYNDHDYLHGIFTKLFEVYVLISDSETLSPILEIFEASFYKRISNDDENPVIRAINKVCGLISWVDILDEQRNMRIDLPIVRK